MTEKSDVTHVDSRADYRWLLVVFAASFILAVVVISFIDLGFMWYGSSVPGISIKITPGYVIGIVVSCYAFGYTAHKEVWKAIDDLSDWGSSE
jgi:uncharacterized membrane protein YqhA